MVFSSSVFLFLFLPVFLVGYSLAPARLRNLVLLAFSLFFYAWGEEALVLVLLASALVDFFCGRMIEAGWRRGGLVLSLVFNLGLLWVFKYLDFTFANYNLLLRGLGLGSDYALALPKVALPIGLSFFTFQTMSYTIDVYRGQVAASRNFLQFATYVSMFPQLVAGPIVRYAEVARELPGRRVSLTDLTEGAERFIIGLTKKVLIANSFAQVADAVFAQEAGDLSSGWVWLGVLAYHYQIYFDFSGYSDMAIGLGRVMGFHFPENFRYPYLARSIREFWRRWHITLSHWFRDYVYIALGGNRRGRFRTYLNLALVFAATGFWHGASWHFVVWGLFHGLFILLERAGLERWLQRAGRAWGHVYMLAVLMMGWVLFRADHLTQARALLGQMFALDAGQFARTEWLRLYYPPAYLAGLFVLGSLLAMPVFPWLRAQIMRRHLAGLYRLGLLGLLALCMMFLAMKAHNPFIYFRF